MESKTKDNEESRLWLKRPFDDDTPQQGPSKAATPLSEDPKISPATIKLEQLSRPLKSAPRKRPSRSRKIIAKQGLTESPFSFTYAEEHPLASNQQLAPPSTPQSDNFGSSADWEAADWKGMSILAEQAAAARNMASSVPPQRSSARTSPNPNPASYESDAILVASDIEILDWRGLRHLKPVALDELLVMRDKLVEQKQRIRRIREWVDELEGTDEWMIERISAILQRPDHK